MEPGPAPGRFMIGMALQRAARRAEPESSPAPTAGAPTTAGDARLLALQRLAGNRAVVSLLTERGGAPARRPSEQVEESPKGAGLRSESPDPTSRRDAETSREPLPMVQRWLTNFAKWDPVHSTGQGTKADAVVGPKYQYGSGPSAKAGFRPYDYTAMFNAATVGAAYCQGHLLNDNLGGPGAPTAAHADENLTAFPQKPTNSDHNKGIEQWVKAAATGSWYQYVVTIGYSTDSAARLRYRLGANVGLAAAAGIPATATTFSYASHLDASWEELIDGKGEVSTAPKAKPGGITGSLSISIPSPMTFAKPTTRALEYPQGKTASWTHLPVFKGSGESVRGGTLPPGGAKNPPPSPARSPVMPMRWRGIEEARTGTAASSPNIVYVAGHQHYNEGVTASRAGPPSANRFGRGYRMGYADFTAGIEFGRKNALTAPPTDPPATVNAHQEFWTGAGKGKLQPLATPPVGNRAEIEGHKDFWAGVEHAKKNAKAVAPTTSLAQVDGHNDYWVGVEHGRKNPEATVPAGGLAQVAGHQAYWRGVKAVWANLKVTMPLELGDARGHTDVLEAAAFGQANARAAVLPEATPVRTAALAGYWKGVDFGRTSPAATAYAGGEAVVAGGAHDYRSGVELAAKDFGSLTGAPPAGGGAREGFEDYRAGVEAAKAGEPADPARAGHARGLDDCTAGMAEGRASLVSKTAPTRTDGGFASGYLHGRGEAGAAAGELRQVPTTTEQAQTVAGYDEYQVGLAAARSDLAAEKSKRPATARGFEEFSAGVALARTGQRENPPGPGRQAATTAWTEYWEGVDFARGNPPTTPYAGTSSAGTAGVTDYRAGESQAGQDLPALVGTPPPGGGAALAFTDYKAGTEARVNGSGDEPARGAFARGWQACGEGLAAGDPAVLTAPTRIDGGFQVGYLHAQGIGAARRGDAAPVGAGTEDVLTASGHQGYLGGVALASQDLESGQPPAPAAARGHADVLAGVTKARTAGSGDAPDGTVIGAVKAWTAYWGGVAYARTHPAPATDPTADAPLRAGLADYRDGYDRARTDLGTLEGGAPAGGGLREGFADYREGVEARKSGGPADAARAGHQLGWQDCVDGMTAGAAALDAPPARSEGGFVSGYFHAQGAAQARAARGEPDAGGLAETARIAGHRGFGSGLAAGRADLGSTPVPPVEAAAHAEYRDGVSHSRISARGVGPTNGSAATTAAFGDYWQGVDFARTNPLAAAWVGHSAGAEGCADYRAGVQHAIANAQGTPAPATTAGAEGATDYWQGETYAPGNVAAPGGPEAADAAYRDYWSGAQHARANLANLQGAIPVGRVAALGFAAYVGGARQADSGAANTQPAVIAHTTGWQDWRDGERDKRAGLLAARTDGGYALGYQNTQPPVLKRQGDPAGGDQKRRH